MRTAIGIVALCSLVAILMGVVALRLRTVQDGTPDDRLLAAMQQVYWGAQTVLDETGEVPNSLDDLMRVAFPDQVNRSEHNLFYQRIRTSNIRLCGEFSTRSSGQATAWPFFDVRVTLQPEFAGPHPSGRHCYDVTLEVTEPAAREDALLFRDMDSAATAVECIFAATGVLPGTIPNEGAASALHRYNPACLARKFIARSRQVPEYTLTNTTSIRLCANFHRGYSTSEKPTRVFDPMRDARFDELTRPRLQNGRHCYVMTMLLPDPRAEVPASAWDEPIDVDKLPTVTRGAAKQDKRAIGDVVNVLRLSRCAFTMSGTAVSTIKEAIQAVASRPGVAERYECGWVPSYFSETYNFPVATYERIDNERIRVCAQFRTAWDKPLALNFYRETFTRWPTSLPELQRPILGPGVNCFNVRLTAIGSGVI